MGVPIHLSVTNQSFYRPYEAKRNGVKATPAGSFGVLNAIAPQYDGSTSKAQTSVKLRFTFLNGETNEPITLARTHFTFYDLDGNGQPVPDVVECISSDDADDVTIGPETELIRSRDPRSRTTVYLTLSTVRCV